MHSSDLLSSPEFMPNQNLLNLLRPLRPTEIVDVGANPVDGEPPYRPMLSGKDLCRVTGFEPQEDALKILLEKKGAYERYLPYAIGNGSVQTLNICQVSGMSSLLTPDQNMLQTFGLFAEFGKVLKQVPVTTRTLDSIDEIMHLDYLKIDIQGGELDVFKNGRQKLADTVVIQTEVSFMPLYQNQPTLGEIDIELRSQGFVPHCFAAVKNWIISPLVINSNPTIPLNQLLEADLVYVKDFTKPEMLSNEQLKHMALISHICYKSFDLAMRCVMLLEQRGVLPKGSVDRYPKMISG